MCLPKKVGVVSAQMGVFAKKVGGSTGYFNNLHHRLESLKNLFGLFEFPQNRLPSHV